MEMQDLQEVVISLHPASLNGIDDLAGSVYAGSSRTIVEILVNLYYLLSGERPCYNA